MLSERANDLEFRDEVRKFVADSLPQDMAARGLSLFSATREDMLGWQKLLNQRGWGAPNWRREHGGTGWTPMQRLIFEEEASRAGAPRSNPQGLTMIGPVLNKFGTPEQREKFLHDILDGNSLWCQGFSEPGSGSDLASLTTRAVRDGDHYVVNGQKIWTSHAHVADWIFLLVRTSSEGPKQAGITFLVADMRSPGITVRPIISIDGQHHLNETFFDNVRVPIENRIGDEGQGWEIAKFLLAEERISSAADVAGLTRLIDRLDQVAGIPDLDGRRPVDDPAFASEIARCRINMNLVKQTVLMSFSEGMLHGAWDSLIGPVVKERASELHQTISELMVRAIGGRGAVYYREDDLHPGANTDGRWAGCTADYLYKRAATIYGGAREVQYDILSKELFRLPSLSQSYSQESQIARDEFERVLAQAADRARRNADLGDNGMRDRWKAFVEFGITGLGEASEAEITFMIGILEEAGRSLNSDPILESGVVASYVLHRCANAVSAVVRDRFQCGDALIVVAVPRHGQAPRVELTSDRAKVAITGVVPCLPAGISADYFLVLAQDSATDEPVLCLVDRADGEMSLIERELIDGAAAADVYFAGTPALPLSRGRELSALLDGIARLRSVGLAAEMFGMAQAVIGQTAAYVGARKQFGQPLGAFQAVRHQLARAIVELSSIHAAVDLACNAEASPIGRADVMGARIGAGLAARAVCHTGIQLHGGMGMTQELQVGHYLKRLVVIDALYGNPNALLGEYAAISVSR